MLDHDECARTADIEETAPAPEAAAATATPELFIVSDEASLNHDRQTQFTCVGRILKAEEDGRLLGQECPVYDCHTFPATSEGSTYAEALTRQLNHLAELLGVLGFQVSYREPRRSSDATTPPTGHFEVRVFALAPSENK
jgi:hypothetical protein